MARDLVGSARSMIVADMPLDNFALVELIWASRLDFMLGSICKPVCVSLPPKKISLVLELKATTEAAATDKARARTENYTIKIENASSFFRCKNKEIGGRGSLNLSKYWLRWCPIIAEYEDS